MNEPRSRNGDEASAGFSPDIRNSGSPQKDEQSLRRKVSAGVSGVSIDLESLTTCTGKQQSSTRRSGQGQSAKNMSRKSVPPVAWNRSEVSETSEAKFARGGMRSESKVTSMRSSLFRKKMSSMASQDDAEAEDEEDSQSIAEAKNKKEESILKRMAELDFALGVN